MFLKKIALNDFKNFNGLHTFDFDKLNLVKGENGHGKTTVALHALLFALYGHSEGNLTSLPTRGKTSPKTSVSVWIEHLGKMYQITRSIPTSINIAIDGVDVNFANNALKQEELNKIFKNVEYFRKFRMVDVKAGVNILEEGKTALKKSLASYDDAFLNNIRKTLMEKKRDREVLNKDTAVLYKHSPSQWRFDTIMLGLVSLTEQVRVIDKDIASGEQVYYGINSKHSSNESQKNQLSRQKNETLSSCACPMCKKGLSKTEQQTLLNDLNTKITSLNEKLVTTTDDLNVQREALSYLKGIKNGWLEQKNKLARLHSRLEARLKQKDYIWTTKDVLVMKKAIEELDTFTSFYIAERVKSLEPIINNVVDKIGFKVEFVINDKGDFDIDIHKNGQVFQYKDLSSGQRLIVTVAFQLALLMEKGDSGLVVADEGFSSLDSKNLTHIFELFKDSEFQLVCILHRFDDASSDMKVISL